MLLRIVIGVLCAVVLFVAIIVCATIFCPHKLDVRRRELEDKEQEEFLQKLKKEG